jgi:hypothetical protein
MAIKRLLIKITLSAIVLGLSVMFVVQVILHHANKTKTFVSPDGQYVVTIYVYSFLSLAMPGQGNDRDGYALVTDLTGRELCKIDVLLAGHIQQTDVRWRGNRVSVLGTDGFKVCVLQ